MKRATIANLGSQSASPKGRWVFNSGKPELVPAADPDATLRMTPELQATSHSENETDESEFPKKTSGK